MTGHRLARAPRLPCCGSRPRWWRSSSRSPPRDWPAAWAGGPASCRSWGRSGCRCAAGHRGRGNGI